MSHSIPEALRRLVRERAHQRCEYCGLAQRGQEATFHIDHIQPLAEGGPTEANNLALACVSCSLRKAARSGAVDPQTQSPSRLYHPRRMRRADHFEWQGFPVIGRTPEGRATVAALEMNRPLILAIREEEALRGRHPPPGPAPAGLSRP